MPLRQLGQWPYSLRKEKHELREPGAGKTGGLTAKEAFAVLQGVRKASAGLRLEAKGLTSTGTELKSEPIISLRETDSETGKCGMDTVKRGLSHERCAVVAKEGPHCLRTLMLSYVLGHRTNAQAGLEAVPLIPKEPEMLSLSKEPEAAHCLSFLLPASCFLPGHPGHLISSASRGLQALVHPT